jgi:hypothetical protein
MYARGLSNNRSLLRPAALRLVRAISGEPEDATSKEKEEDRWSFVGWVIGQRVSEEGPLEKRYGLHKGFWTREVFDGRVCVRGNH